MPRIRHGSALMFDLQPDADHRKIMERLCLGVVAAFDQVGIWTQVPVAQDDLGKNYKAEFGPESHVALHYRQWSNEPGMKHLFADLKQANFPLVDFRDSPLHAPEPDGDLPSTWLQCQMNFFPDGLILVFSAFHVAIDLVTEALSVARWSEAVSATYEDETPDFSELQPECHDRSVLIGGDKNANMEALGVHKFDLMEMLNNQETNENAVVLFKFSPLNLNKLKKAASGADAKKWVSTADAMEAFTWRHVIRARDRAAGNRGEGNCRILSGVNMRGRMKQDIPAEYVGACTAMAPLDASRELLHSRSPEALNQLAYHIRTSLSSWNGSAWVNGMIGTWPKLDLQEMVWYKDAGELLFTDHSAFPCYVVNWGPDLGQMIAWREPYIQRPPPKGEVMILPKSLDGSSEFMVTLEPEAMKVLLADREFRDFADLMVICNDGGVDMTSTSASKL